MYIEHNMIEIQCAVESDFDEWMTLVEMLRDNFPGLETSEGLTDYGQTLKRNIERGSALCAKVDGVIVGILLYSVKHNMLSCMAVHPDHRRRGVAKALIIEMLKRLDRSRDITVTTFREGDPLGIAPRALYKKMGFIEGELVMEFDYPNQVFILPAQ